MALARATPSLCRRPREQARSQGQGRPKGVLKVCLASMSDEVKAKLSESLSDTRLGLLEMLGKPSAPRIPDSLRASFLYKPAESPHESPLIRRER